MLAGIASRGKGEGGLAGAGNALAAGADLGQHPCSCSQVFGYPLAKITSAKGEQSKSAAAYQREETVKSLRLGKNAQRQKGMSVSTAPELRERGYGEMLPALRGATLLLAGDI